MITEEPSKIAKVPQANRTVWVFRDTSQLPIRYMGRCIPEIPRNCLNRFTKPGDLVLDPFMGSGTAVGECIELGRRVIGVDPTDGALRATRLRLERYFPTVSMDEHLTGENRRKVPYCVMKGDSRRLPIKDGQIDFVFAHIPYWSVITYSKPEEKNSSDMSRIWSLGAFHKELLQSFTELHRVLKSEKFCAVLVGDVRQGGRKVPLGYTTLALLLASGFQFYDQMIKVTDNAISMRRPVVMKKAVEEDRSITVHEYVIVVKKAKGTYNDIGLDFLKERHAD